MAEDNPTSVSVQRAAAQGYLLLPPIATPIRPATCFSTALAATPAMNPFVSQHTPFDLDRLESSNFIYRTQDNCRGTYLSSSTNSSSSSYDHLSLSLGVSVGNAVLGASVTGSYDKSVLEDRSKSKTSRKTSFQAGAVQFQRPPPLSEEARQLLLPENGGFDAFTKRFGDFYVSGFTIGGDASVVISQATSKSQNVEKLKVELEVRVLCFSDTETIAEVDTSTSSFDVELNLYAFDSLDRSFVEFSAANGTALRFVDARKLAVEYGWRVDRMPARIEESVKSLGTILDARKPLSWGQVGGVLQSNVVSNLILLPFSTHREVRGYVNG
ncbi:unnamed protein product [Periconia digitata]|uniref:Uncharacterized protein n=1 Tax=Periconia digitata TaxID=1303443 RepID=A0A9W4XHC0_9PLEO|nr:unnamed protein product [Periconia digitata]